jgi:hypothetical protein
MRRAVFDTLTAAETLPLADHYRPRGSAQMGATRRLWMGLAVLLVTSFGVLLWMGRELYQQAPPIPARVETASGQLVFTRSDIENRAPADLDARPG